MNNSIHTATHDFAPFTRRTNAGNDYTKHILD
jgi:hypothetical protein